MYSCGHKSIISLPLHLSCHYTAAIQTRVIPNIVAEANTNVSVCVNLLSAVAVTASVTLETQDGTARGMHEVTWLCYGYEFNFKTTILRLNHSKKFVVQFVEECYHMQGLKSLLVYMSLPMT